MTRTRTDKGNEEAERDKTLCVCLLFHLIKYFSHFAAILRLLHCIHLIEWYLLHIYGILTQRWRSHWSRLWRASLWRYIRIQAILQVPLLLQLQLLCGRLALLPCNCLCRHYLSLSIAVAVDLLFVCCLLFVTLLVRLCSVCFNAKATLCFLHTLARTHAIHTVHNSTTLSDCYYLCFDSCLRLDTR